MNEPMPQAFIYAPTIDGFEVIDQATGRPVDTGFETPREANGRAQFLNQVALNGPKALARALRAS